MDTDNNKPDVILLSGFLGAGKTTLLSRLLSWKDDLSDTVVIVNEFGDLGIDGALVEGEAEIIELVSGCICCTLQIDLRKLLDNILLNYKVKWIFIEASGLADARALNLLLDEYILNNKIVSYKVVTLLDAEMWPAREVMGPVFTRQLEGADLILLNKSDLVDESEVKVFINELRKEYSRAQALPTVYCQIDLDDMVENLFILPREWTGFPQENNRIDASGWISFSFKDKRLMDEERFKVFMDKLPEEIYRLKGMVKFPTGDVLVNHVGKRTEWSDRPNAPETALTFIGRGDLRDEVLENLKSCLLK